MGKLKARKALPHVVEQRGVVSTARFDVRSGWEQWYLLMSDNHHDSVYCNRELEIEHLEEAQRRKARIIVTGDWFDAMQGRFDPRRSMEELREEYRRPDYYDFVVTDCAKFLLPYAHLIDVLADGNHELAVLKNANTNLMDRMVSHLNEKAGTQIKHGGDGGDGPGKIEVELAPSFLAFRAIVNDLNVIIFMERNDDAKAERPQYFILWG